jgi:DNA-binding protein WhiA
LTIKSKHQQIFKDLMIDFNKQKYSLEEIKGFIIGAFLSSGSISSLNDKNYHLEIRSANYKFLLFIQRIIKKFHISISLIKRRNKYILYLKKTRDISDFLKIVGAYESMHLFEEKLIMSDLSNQITKLNNLDIANLKKICISSNSQIMMIHKVKNTP